MRKVSEKQRRINAELAKIKAEKPDVCVICGNFCGNGDLMHLLPKSIFPQYYIEPFNLWKAHRYCHQQYDDNKEIRQIATRAINYAKQFATDGEIFQYFGL